MSNRYGNLLANGEEMEHLVGLTVGIYYDARTYEGQITKVVYIFTLFLGLVYGNV
jgi:hypothetical protein